MSTEEQDDCSHTERGRATRIYVVDVTVVNDVAPGGTITFRYHRGRSLVAAMESLAVAATQGGAPDDSPLVSITLRVIHTEGA